MVRKVTCSILDHAMAPTVLIVDDHPGYRAAARTVLEADGFEVVGEAATGLEAVSEAARLRPHVVLLDIGLPDIDGIEVARRITAARPADAGGLGSRHGPVPVADPEVHPAPGVGRSPPAGTLGPCPAP